MVRPMDKVWNDARVERGMASQMERLESGSAVVGWKLGLGAKAAMEAAGTSGPILGYLTSDSRLVDGAAADIQGWQKAALEPEIAIYLGATLPAGAEREQAEAAISGLGIAYELVDLDQPLEQVEKILSGNIFHRSYMLGEAVSARAGGDTSGIALEVLRQGEVVVESSDPEAVVGNLVDLTLHTADYLAAFGRTLEAGHFIISGSVVPPILPEPGDRVEYRGGDLGQLTLSFT